MSPMFKGVLWFLFIIANYGLVLPAMLSAKSTVIALLGIFLGTFLTVYLFYHAWRYVKGEL